MTTPSKSFGAQLPKKPHLMQQSGGIAAEVLDLRKDVELGFLAAEARTGFPELDFVNGSGPAAAGGDMVLAGRNLLQGQTFDSLTLWETTSAVVITALTPGDSGFTIQITDGATAGAEVVTKTGSAFVIQIEAGVSTANQIATAINANGADSDGYLRAASGGAGATNAVAAATAMTGGVGDFAGNAIYVAGLVALPANTAGTAGAAAWTDTSVTVTVPSLLAAGLSGGDVYRASLQSNGVWSNSLMLGGASTGSLPELDFVDGAGPAAAGGDMVLVGRNLLQGQTFDTLTLWETTSAVVITALTPGASGFTIEITDGATAGSEVVTKTGNAFVIQIEAGVSTANQIATAINANTADSDGYLRAASGGAGTTNAVAAATAMAGGVGDFAGNLVYAAGKLCLPANTAGTAGAAAWTNTGVTVTVPALAPAVATDKANVTLMSNGTRAAYALTVAVE